MNKDNKPSNNTVTSFKDSSTAKPITTSVRPSNPDTNSSNSKPTLSKPTPANLPKK